MTAHTPGPYHFDGSLDTHGSGIVKDSRNAWLADVYDVDELISSEEAMANGTLFAAAPDMLSALNDIVEMDDLHANEAPECNCALHTFMAAKAYAAIAKATEGDAASIAAEGGNG